MLQGAVSLTDESEYLQACFTDSESIQFYSLDQLDQLPQMVNMLLSDQELAESIAQQGYQLAVQSHTWTNRLQELLDMG